MISLVWKYNNANFLKAANEYPISLRALYLSKLLTLLKCLDWSKDVNILLRGQPLTPRMHAFNVKESLYSKWGSG